MSIGGMAATLSTGTTTSSASGESGRRTFTKLVLVSMLGGVVAPGTTAGTLLDPTVLRPATSKTDAGQPAVGLNARVTVLAELRNLTGLTWDQVATLFGVSRRAVHFWASGKTMAAAHHEHLQRTLGCLRIVDRGNAPANRNALFGPTENGIAPFDLLVERKYDEFIAMLAHGKRGKPTTLKPARVSPNRLPQSPHTRADAQEDTVHMEAGPPRLARVVKVPRGQ